MSLGDGIRKHGFRKWYERELLQSHAHLVLTFLCAIGLFAAFEALTHERSLGNQLWNVLAVFILGAAGIWALRRYLYLLLHAETLANQAECPHCRAYGRFKLVDASANADGDDVHVQCNKCEHRWHIAG